MRSELRKVAWLVMAAAVGMSGCGEKAPDPVAEIPEEEILDPSVAEELAVEEKQLAKIHKGLKAKMYRSTRKGLVKGTLAVMAAVEGQAAHPILDTLPQGVRETVSAAGGEAGALKMIAEDPPAEIGLVVATGFLVHLQKTPALCELALVDEERFATPGGRSGFHVVRGATYFMHGLKQHGLRDLRSANVGGAERLAPEVRTAIYYSAAAAAIAADEPRMARTQLELAEALSPGDPMVVFLRAEREISKARYGDAGEMLSGWRGENPEADGLVPGVIDGRIADLREGGESLKTVLLDPKWVVNFGLDYIAEQAGDSEAFRKLDEVTGTSRTLMSEMLEGFTGFGL